MKLKSKKDESLNDLIRDSREIGLERAGEIEKEIEGEPAQKEEKKQEESLDKIKEKAGLADNYYDQLLRLRAEFDNYRKRMNKEREESQETAREEVIYELLGIIDNFERAIKTAEEMKDFKGVFEGIVLIHKQVNEFLNRYGVRPIEAEGKKFDPEYHEAVGHSESDGHAEDTVTEEVIKGYTFKDRVLRHAQVKVSKKKNDAKKEGNQEGNLWQR